MKKSFLKQLWVALKIWVIALVVNTFAGNLYLAGEFDTYIETYFDTTVILYGLLYGAAFSLPVALILLIIINHCVARRKNGMVIFRYVFITALLLSLLSSLFFIAAFWGAPKGIIPIAMLAAIAGTGSQYHAFFKLAKYDNDKEIFPS
jgi:hypothetical protein